MTWGTDIWGVGIWGAGAAPVLTDISPVDGETNVDPATAIVAEVTDDNADLEADTVDIYVNETLAWRNDSPLPGFTGERTEATNGYRYTITPAAPFERGVQTVRGTALDAHGHAMNDFYSFTTRQQYVTEETIAAVEEQTTGLDLYLDTGHDLVVEDYDLRLVTGTDEVGQHLLVALRLFLGEWYLDEGAGMAYYRDVFVNAPQARVIEILFRQAILSDEDIERIQEFELEVDQATRHLDVSFTAVSSIGEVNVSAVFP